MPIVDHRWFASACGVWAVPAACWRCSVEGCSLAAVLVFAKIFANFTACWLQSSAAIHIALCFPAQCDCAATVVLVAAVAWQHADKQRQHNAVKVQDYGAIVMLTQAVSSCPISNPLLYPFAAWLWYCMVACKVPQQQLCVPWGTVNLCIMATISGIGAALHARRGGGRCFLAKEMASTMIIALLGGCQWY